MDELYIYEDIINDELKINCYHDNIPLLKEELRTDIIKLRLEYSTVLLNNQIYYKAKIDELNKQIKFRDEYIEFLKNNGYIDLRK